MPDHPMSASPQAEDAVERAAAGAGLVHLERAAACLDRLRHELDLAAACSDLCAVPDAGGLLSPLWAAIALRRGLAAAAIERSAARERATGIRARRSLPSPTYDHLFRLIADHGRTVCVMVPGYQGYDPDYWEEVPPDGGAPSAASPTR
jgi:hypothetical protein